MRKIVLFSAMSLDGFIAKDDDNLDWLMKFDLTLDKDAFVKHSVTYEEFYDTIDTAVMGNGTYRYVTEKGIPNPYPDKKSYVFTKEDKKDNGYVEFVSDDILEFTRDLQNEEGRDIWLVGGSVINGLFLEADMIDEIILDIFPVVLGHGKKLFQADLEFKNYLLEYAETYPTGRIQVKYYRKRPK